VGSLPQQYTAQHSRAALAKERPYNRIRSRVCNQGRRPQRGVLLEQAVEDDHRVAQSARHYEPEETDAAGRGVVDVGHTFAAAEVFGVRTRVYRADRNDEADSVGRGQFPAAQSLRQRERGVDVDEAVVGGRYRVATDIALGSMPVERG
jgi:hypothetical protein